MPDPNRLFSPEAHATGEAEEIWAWMRAEAPIYQHESTTYGSLRSITRHADIRAVYRDHVTFSSEAGVILRPLDVGDDPGRGLAMALTDPPRHRGLRTLVGRHFSNRAVQELGRWMGNFVRDALDSGVERGVLDLAHDLTARLSLEAIATLIGIEECDRAQLFEECQAAFSANTALTARRYVMVCLLELMEARQAHPADDVMSALVHGTVDGAPLTVKEILLNCENLLGASENAALSVSAGLAAFVRWPDEYRRLRRDRDLLPTAVEEMFRWASSAVHSRRTVTSTTSIAGEVLRPGDTVVLWVPSANRDETIFGIPGLFDVARTHNKHLAFAAGEHFCVGANLARLQAKVVLDTLLDRVESLESAASPEYVRSIAVRGPAHLPVRISLH